MVLIWTLTLYFCLRVYTMAICIPAKRTREKTQCYMNVFVVLVGFECFATAECEPNDSQTDDRADEGPRPPRYELYLTPNPTNGVMTSGRVAGAAPASTENAVVPREVARPQ